MKEVKFKNEFFKSEKLNDNSTVITVLKDDFNFFDINLKDCKFITNSNGFIADDFTDKAINSMNNYLAKSNSEFKNLDELKIELRNRMLNMLISQISN